MRAHRHDHKTNHHAAPKINLEVNYGLVMRKLSSALIDENLPPATRRQRHISLAMLQARMYSEAEAATIHAATSKTSKSSVTGHGHSAASSMDSSVISLRWPQFLDESHVFWCATCKGDLIVL